MANNARSILADQLPANSPYSGFTDSAIFKNGAVPIRNRVNGRTISALPNIIWEYRNAREDRVGYDDPTYFGFFIDIHSRNIEADEMINPFTSGRANPLFYYPINDPGKADGFGKMSKINTGVDAEYSQTLGSFINEASAIQYINHYSPNLSLTPDYYYANQLLFPNKAQADLIGSGNKPTSNKINRAYYLTKFKSILNLIQEKTPWTFKELDGINSLWASTFGAKPSSVTEQNPEIVLTVTCDETVDLRVNKLGYYYKMLSYDSFNKRKILPHNLEEFSMDVYFLDLRYINKLGPDGSVDQNFKNQIQFGGVAFRCYGCTFDFSGMHDAYSTQIKSYSDSPEHTPKFKIKVSRVLPATYFGRDSFGESQKLTSAKATNGGLADSLLDRNVLDGGFDLGPFTGGVTRVLTQIQTAATNLINTPITALNDAVSGVQRRFEDAVSAGLARNGVQTNPYGKKTAEEILGSRKGDSSKTDLFTGKDIRTTNPIKTDVFPGQDTRTDRPINYDVFPTSPLDSLPVLPINKDVFPGNSTAGLAPILDDVFPGPTPSQTAPPITRDIFPGQDTRIANPITNDVFPKAEQVANSPISNDIFPGGLEIDSSPIKTDVFEGKDTGRARGIQTEIFSKKSQDSGKPIQNDVYAGSSNIPRVQGLSNTYGKTSAEVLVNQRKSGGRIVNKNPLK